MEINSGIPAINAGIEAMILSMVTLFALHLMAAIPNPAPYLEYSIEHVEWIKGLFEPALTIENGKIPFPDGPGWGVQVNRSWLEKAACQISGDK